MKFINYTPYMLQKKALWNTSSFTFANLINEVPPILILVFNGLKIIINITPNHDNQHQVKLMCVVDCVRESRMA